jgi:hypothetical protein
MRKVINFILLVLTWLPIFIAAYLWCHIKVTWALGCDFFYETGQYSKETKK